MVVASNAINKDRGLYSGEFQMEDNPYPEGSVMPIEIAEGVDCTRERMGFLAGRSEKKEWL